MLSRKPEDLPATSGSAWRDRRSLELLLQSSPAPDVQGTGLFFATSGPETAALARARPARHNRDGQQAIACDWKGAPDRRTIADTDEVEAV